MSLPHCLNSSPVNLNKNSVVRWPMGGDQAHSFTSEYKCEKSGLEWHKTHLWLTIIFSHLADMDLWIPGATLAAIQTK